MMIKKESITLYNLLAPTLLVLSSLIMVSPVSTISQHKQLHRHILNITLPAWSIVILQSCIYSHWFLLLSTFCIYKTLTKYQVLLKHYYIYHAQNILMDFQSKTTFNKKNNDTQVMDVGKNNIGVECKEACSLNKDTTIQPSLISTKKKTNHNKQKHQNQNQNQQQKQQQQKQKLAMDHAKSQEWIVVPEGKKNKKQQRASSVPSAAAAATTTATIPAKEKQRRSSIPTVSQPCKTKSKCKNQKATSKSASSSPMINNNNNKVHNNSSIVSPTKLPWSNIVKSRENEPDTLNNNHDDVPFLSDNESSTGSIESPCLSHKDLFHQPTTTSTQVENGESKYYSPFFSTGIDFGVLPTTSPSSSPSQQKLTEQFMGHSNIDNRLDEYLNSQQPYWNSSNKQYTPSQQQHKNSILNLLNQSDQFETTITPTAFKYFDDMMMSTSLYKTNDNVNKFSSLMDMNKRDWNSISSHYVR